MEAGQVVRELLALQGIDIEILKSRAKLETLGAEALELDERADGARRKAEQARAAVVEIRRREAGASGRVRAGRQTLKALDQRLTAVTNAQQHLAVRTEQDVAKRNLAEAEDEQLEAMIEADSAREALADAEEEVAAAEAAVAERGGEAERERVEHAARLESLAGERQAQVSRLDKRTLHLYRQASGGGGPALVELTSDGACGHCFTAVTKQMQAEVRGGGRLASCEACGAILYVAPPSRAKSA